MATKYHVYENYGYLSEMWMGEWGTSAAAEHDATTRNAERDPSEVPEEGNTGALGTVKYEVIRELPDGSLYVG